MAAPGKQRGAAAQARAPPAGSPGALLVEGLCAAVETHIQVGRFENVDLFERGCYAVGIRFAFNGPAPVCLLPVDSPARRTRRRSSAPPVVAAASHHPPAKGQHVGLRTGSFEVRFKHQEADLEARAGIRASLPLDCRPGAEPFAEQLAEVSGTLHVDLWFHETEAGSLARVSTASFHLPHLAQPGLCYARDVSFDYFHTCTVAVAVHSRLVGIEPLEADDSVILPPGALGQGSDPWSCLGGNGLAPRTAAQLLFPPLNAAPSPPPARRPTATIVGSRAGAYAIEPEGDAAPGSAGGEWRVRASELVASLTGVFQSALSGCEDEAAVFGRCGSDPQPFDETLTSRAQACCAVLRADVSECEVRDAAASQILSELGTLSALLSAACDASRGAMLGTEAALAVLRLAAADAESVQHLRGHFLISPLQADGNARDEQLLQLSTRLRQTSYIRLMPQKRVVSLHQVEDLAVGALVFEERPPALCRRRSSLAVVPTAAEEQRDNSLHRVHAGTRGRLADGAPCPRFRTEHFSDHFHHVQEEQQGPPRSPRTPRTPRSIRARAPARPSLKAFDLAYESLSERFEGVSMLRHAGMERLERLIRRPQGGGKGHLVVCVHGMSGNQHDLRLYRLALARALPGATFLMSAINQDNTHRPFEELSARLWTEVREKIVEKRPRHLSFVGHSLGCIIVRALLDREDVARLLSSGNGPRLHTFLSLSGPHLGAMYLDTLVSTGMWLLAKWKKSGSLEQLALNDASNPRDTFIYRLSKSKGLRAFQNILLVSSPQDKYVTTASALLVPDRQSRSDLKRGPVYQEMIKSQSGILSDGAGRLSRLTVVLGQMPRNLNTFIGRTAHVALLDDQLLVDRLVAVVAEAFTGSDA